MTILGVRVVLLAPVLASFVGAGRVAEMAEEGEVRLPSVMTGQTLAAFVNGVGHL